MKIFITGGTGLIGQELIKALHNHEITILTRSIEKARTLIPNNIALVDNIEDFDNFNDFDAVINLAGEPIIDRAWTDKQKAKLTSSRWKITSQLVDKIQASSTPPSVFLSGSAVGIYGNQDSKAIDEYSKFHAEGFAHDLCQRWESIAQSAQSDKTRVCIMRTGIVLSKNGGALKRMLLPYKLGLGGPIGSGKQYVPWIHISDMVAAIVFLLTTENAKGVFNFTAPFPVKNVDFSKCLAKTLWRPHLFFVPKFMLTLSLGEASHLLLDSQRVLPHALLESGYHFRFSEIKAALQDLFS